MSDSAFSAQYGGGGMVYNQISKGGTNQFHGMAYDYFKNTALNASPFGFNGVSFKTPQHFNDFGGNIGGPVIKNKVFFFFAIENTINHTTPAVSFTPCRPWPCVRATSPGMNPIYDPTTQTVDPATERRDPPAFPNNQIPAAMLDPVAKNIQALLPATQSAGPGRQRHRHQQLQLPRAGQTPEAEVLRPFRCRRDEQQPHHGFGSLERRPDQTVQPGRPDQPEPRRRDEHERSALRLLDHQSQADQRIPHRLHGRIRYVSPRHYRTGLAGETGPAVLEGRHFPDRQHHQLLRPWRRDLPPIPSTKRTRSISRIR